MASTYRVQVDLGELLNLSGASQAGAFRNIQAAVERLAMAGAERWKSAALKAKLYPAEAQAYADSISYQLTGPFSATISATYKYVEDIETGRPARDLKRMLDTSMKVRQGKRGRYLIIPMAHQTPGTAGTGGKAMPQDVYEQASGLTASQTIGQGRRRIGIQAQDAKTRSKYLTRNVYRWGARLAAGLAPKLKERHATDPYASMYRFSAESGKSGRYSKYLTFRTMGEWQTGAWIIPAQPGQHIAQDVAAGLQADAEKIFPVAASMDVRDLTG